MHSGKLQVQARWVRSPDKAAGYRAESLSRDGQSKAAGYRAEAYPEMTRVRQQVIEKTNKQQKQKKTKTTK